MGTLNKVQIIGYLGRDAELKYIPNGTAVASISIATTEVWKDKNGQKKEATEWHRCSVWDKQAETLAEYLTKGRLVYVEGRIQTSKWKDKDGNERESKEIRVDRITLLGKKEQSQPQTVDAVSEAAEIDDRDIPF